MENPDNLPTLISALQMKRSFYQMDVIEATVKEQLMMQSKQLDHQKVVMDLKFEILRVRKEANDLQERLDQSECSNRILEMSVEKLGYEKQFLQSKLKYCESQVQNGDQNLATKKEELRDKEKQHNEKINQVCDNHEREKKKLTTQISTLQAEHQQQLQQMKMQRDDLTARNASLTRQLAELNQKIELQQIQRLKVTQTLEENFKDFLDMAEVHENHELICLIKQKLDACQAEIKNARESLSKFEGSSGFKGSSLSNIIDTIHEDLEKRKQQIEQMRIDNILKATDMLKQLVEGYEVDDPNEILSALSEQIKIHLYQCKEAKSNVQVLIAEKQGLAVKAKDDGDKLNALRELNNKLDGEVKLLNQSVDAFAVEVESLRQQNGELKAKLSRSQELVKQKEMQSKQTHSKVQQNLNAFKDKQQELRRCANELQKLGQSQREKQEQIKDLLKENGQLKQQVIRQSNQMEDKSKTLSEQCKKYQDQLSIFQQQSESLRSQANEKIANSEKQLQSCQQKVQSMQSELADLANKHIQAHHSQKEQRIQSYHQAIQYFQNLISSNSSTPKTQDLFSVPSLSKSFESQQNWINGLISLYSNSKAFTSQFVARFEFISPKDLETYLTEPNTLLICETSFKKVFAIFICKLSKIVKEVDPVVLFSSDCPLAYPSQPKKGTKCRPAMVLTSNLNLAKKQIVIQKSLQVSLQSGEYFGEIDRQKLFGIEDNSSKLKIEKMEIHRIIKVE